jgi:hypothetical protein
MSRFPPPWAVEEQAACFRCDRHHRPKSQLRQNDFMEHRGIRYAIKIGIAREQWRVAILIPGKRLSEERKVSGTREDAETTARSMINAWLKKRDEARGPKS